MSLPSDSSPHKKHKSEDDVQSPVDHRKRRRNRTTQSCLNCHGSKRMCDRKRPACGRCVKLGLSGICVYEVDDASQRSTDKDENSHLKNRIAELEGFIREYKRKPHPRWATVEPKKGSELSSSSPPVSDAGSEAESPFETKESLSFDSNDSVTSASSPCELVPHTPPAHSKEPVFLTGQDNVSSFLFSGDDSLSSLQSGTSFNLRSGQVSASHREGIDDMVGFDNVILPGDENEVFERVFSQILQQDACRSAKAENACQCMNKSSAYSVVLSLAPHVRRALDALGALPEHRALQMGESCRYLKHVKDLESVISAVVESVSTSLSTSSTCSVQNLDSLNRNSETSTISTEDSPLQRVLAARRATIAQPPFPVLAPHASSVLNAPQKQMREDSLLWGLRDRSASENLVGHSVIDQFMTWDPPSRFSWPSTISL